jgi:hypothetical protein
VFLIAPTTRNISNITGTTVTPTLSGGGGTSYQIAIGTSPGTSNTVGWRVATTGTQITGLTFATRTLYYISAYASNTTNSARPLLPTNSSKSPPPRWLWSNHPFSILNFKSSL